MDLLQLRTHETGRLDLGCAVSVLTQLCKHLSGRSLLPGRRNDELSRVLGTLTRLDVVTCRVLDGSMEQIRKLRLIAAPTSNMRLPAQLLADPGFCHQSGYGIQTNNFEQKCLSRY